MLLSSFVSLFGGSLNAIAIGPYVPPNGGVAPKIPECEIVSTRIKKFDAFVI